MTTFYISGPITTDPEYKTKFALAEKLLSRLGDVVNPAAYEDEELDTAKFTPEGIWAKYMAHDLKTLEKAAKKPGRKVLVHLDGWESSRGACLEHEIAFCVHGFVPYEIQWILPEWEDLLKAELERAREAAK